MACGSFQVPLTCGAVRVVGLWKARTVNHAGLSDESSSARGWAQLETRGNGKVRIRTKFYILFSANQKISFTFMNDITECFNPFWVIVLLFVRQSETFLKMYFFR